MADRLLRNTAPIYPIKQTSAERHDPALVDSLPRSRAENRSSPYQEN
jgi:hypothetical protein